MNLLNTTSLVAEYTMATDNRGRESLVVVAKGTYGMPNWPDVTPELAGEQVALVTSDVFAGEPGISAPLYEMDFAPYKPRCDVLLNGQCYAPNGTPASRVDVGLRVGPLVKSFRVVGHRVYQKALPNCTPSSPTPFDVLPIGYEQAYGGVDRTDDDPLHHRWYMPNHVGVGYYPKLGLGQLDGRPLPNTEELDQPVVRPDGSYRPMAFGPVARVWPSRLRWAGTYDKQWLDEQYPFLPLDFDERYFQATPEDQQMAYPRGGEEVILKNLTPKGWTSFRLPPKLDLPVVFVVRGPQLVEVAAVVDTIHLEPDLNRLTLVWRASMALRRNIREVFEVVIGERASDLERAQARGERVRGKRVGSLGDNVDWLSGRPDRDDEDDES